MTKKIELEGELFTLVEEDGDDVSICAEIAGVDIWKWLRENNGENVKITLEIKDKETE
jgi:phosphotransferase system IIA component